MEKGRLIGKGMTAEVYEWGPDKVLKLYFERFGEDWAKFEARVGRTVHEAGVASPAVYDMVEVDGRKGVIFERIHGTSMLRQVLAEPWNVFNYAKDLVELQYSIHCCSAENLPTQKERFAIRINSTRELTQPEKRRIMEYIDRLPDGNSVCHGDLHFNNIIISKNKLVPIDWTSAYQGNPSGDVARTCLMMCSPSKTHGQSDLLLYMTNHSSSSESVVRRPVH